MDERTKLLRAACRLLATCSVALSILNHKSTKELRIEIATLLDAIDRETTNV